MALMSMELSERSMPSQEEDISSSNRYRYRRMWRTAYWAISCARAFLLVVGRRSAINLPTRVHTLSYVAIDIPNTGGTPSGSGELRPFDVDTKKLSETVSGKNIGSLNDLAGVEGVTIALQSNSNSGISRDNDEIARRRKEFGANRYIKPPARGFLSFFLEAFKDMAIIILLVCAILSLVFGIKKDGLKEGWYDGGSIIFAVILVVSVSAVSNFKQNRQFEALADKSSDIRVEVVRDGMPLDISVFDVVVGDVANLKIGGQIPADGLFLNGGSLKVDESSMTGEGDHVEVSENNPFLLSGTKVTDGYGSMLVTSVGMSTAWGKMMSTISHELKDQPPLQARLNQLSSYIWKIALTVALSVLLVMLIRYFTGNTRDEMGNREFRGRKTKFNDVMNSVINIIAAAAAILVVAIPKVLPAVTLTLAYSMKQMMGDKALVRELAACETMGSATTICTDKTGTLTLNQMNVTKFWVGKEAMDTADTELPTNVLELLVEAIGLNTVGSVYRQVPESAPEITGNPTEKAILYWATVGLGMDTNQPKQYCRVIRVDAFNSEKKRSGVWMRRINENTINIHMMGAAEIILAMCSHYYVKSGAVEVIDDEERMQIATIIKDMAAQSLQCIVFAHKEVPEQGQIQEGLEVEETGLTLLGIVGLKNLCRPGVKEAVESCRKAGVQIKMVTGDNMHTAKAVAIECGILSPIDLDLNDEAVVEGVKFRNYTSEEQMAKIDDIRVMARSSPHDKHLMVQTLKEKGHVVAVTGDGANDAPALKEADIGLSMGIQGTEVAKESSDIIILDDDFTTVVKVMKRGRCLWNNIKKFLQLRLTLNVVALVINFVAAVSSAEVPLTAVQLLWLSLIMDCLGALALATEKPTDDPLEKLPIGRTKPLITRAMWMNLIFEALYQVAVLLTLHFRGRSIFKVSERAKNTMIFNAFVFFQVFNEFNAMKHVNNIFKGLHKSKLFLPINAIIILLQLMMVEILRKFGSTERLKWQQWAACIAIASMAYFKYFQAILGLLSIFVFIFADKLKNSHKL